MRTFIWLNLRDKKGQKNAWRRDKNVIKFTFSGIQLYVAVNFPWNINLFGLYLYPIEFIWKNRHYMDEIIRKHEIIFKFNFPNEISLLFGSFGKNKKKGKYQTISTYCYGNAFSLHQPIVIRPLISILFPFHTDCHFSLSPSFVYDYFVVNNIDRARKNEFSARLNWLNGIIWPFVVLLTTIYQ